MKIRCKLIREGGTTIDIDGDEYHFADDGKGNHVAEVSNKAHIKHLLSIKEAYVAHGGNIAAEEPDEEKRDEGDDNDLKSMDKDSLLALAEEKQIEVNPDTPLPALRKKLAKSIAAKAAE